MNSPAMQAALTYVAMFGDDGEDYLTFGQMMDAYLVNGYVLSNPDYFICARPVVRSADPDDIINAVYPFNLDECDAWFVGMMAGDTRLIWTYCPVALQYCGYQRRGSPIRWFNTEKIRHKIMGSSPKVTKPKDPPKTPAPPTLDNRDTKDAARMAQRNRAGRRGQKSTLLSNKSTPAAAGGMGTKNLLG